MIIGASKVGQMIAPTSMLKYKSQNQNQNNNSSVPTIKAKVPQAPHANVPQLSVPGGQKSGGFKPLTMDQLYHDETIGNRVDIIL